MFIPTKLNSREHTLQCLITQVSTHLYNICLFNYCSKDIYYHFLLKNIVMFRLVKLIFKGKKRTISKLLLQVRY